MVFMRVSWGRAPRPPPLFTWREGAFHIPHLLTKSVPGLPKNIILDPLWGRGRFANKFASCPSSYATYSTSRKQGWMLFLFKYSLFFPLFLNEH